MTFTAILSCLDLCRAFAIFYLSFFSYPVHHIYALWLPALLQRPHSLFLYKFSCTLPSVMYHVAFFANSWMIPSCSSLSSVRPLTTTRYLVLFVFGPWWLHKRSLPLPQYSTSMYRRLPSDYSFSFALRIWTLPDFHLSVSSFWYTASALTCIMFEHFVFSCLSLINGTSE